LKLEVSQGFGAAASVEPPDLGLKTIGHRRNRFHIARTHGAYPVSTESKFRSRPPSRSAQSAAGPASISIEKWIRRQPDRYAADR
jgi:hypothetical protein